jgi:3-phosphoshikimate 1-carboxyvinyltransferase
MRERILTNTKRPLLGEMEIPGDKSISHRAVIFGSLAKGKTKVTHFLNGEDCMRTIDAFQKLGVKIKVEGSELLIEGKGIDALKEPLEPLNFGNSGTTTRLMLGLLAGLPFFSTIYGDASLSKRPMDRVIQPLQKMGASFTGRDAGNLLPIAIEGRGLKGMTYKLPVKSAQVKSAILLAGLTAEGETTVIEPAQTRDHTERMLKAFGADVRTDKNQNQITVTNQNELTAVNVHVPGDISSAAFFLVAAAIVPGSDLTLKNVGLNYSRSGLLEVMKQMGASLEIANKHTVSGEPVGDLRIQYSELKGTVMKGDLIPRLIDEIPILALLATQAKGTTIIQDAEELKVKETDRIAAVVEVLTTLGANIEATDDGMKIHGKTPLTGGKVGAYHDHRIAMMNAVASLIAKEEVIIDDISSIAISYPDFFTDMKKVLQPSEG